MDRKPRNTPRGSAREYRSYEEDSSPRNMPPRPRLERGDPLPSGYGEGYTPAPGETPMRDDREVIPMSPRGPVRRMKAGGAVTRGDGCAARGKTKGRMI